MVIENQDYWLDIFKQWQASGLTQKAFCARNEIPYGQFVTWRSRLIESGVIQSARYGGKAVRKPRAEFMPVSIAPAIERRPMIELSLGHGVLLRMPGGV